VLVLIFEQEKLVLIFEPEKFQGVSICPCEVVSHPKVTLSLFGIEKNKHFRTNHRKFRTLRYTSHLAFKHHFFSLGNVVRKSKMKAG